MNNFYHGYWKYYSDAFDWNESSFLQPLDDFHTKEIFKSAGLSGTQANELMASGYVCLPDGDVVIDRFYGGALASGDGVSRFHPDDLQELFSEPRSRIWVKRAHSLKELHQIVNETQSRSRKPILFRGQRNNYSVKRTINNPNFTIPGVGEVSLLSSFWRKAYALNRNCFCDFHSLSLFEWSKIFYSAYDLKEIEMRHKAAIDNGEWMYLMQDMADSDDPLLSEFGNHRLDLAMGMNANLADTLSTLLQHYGLISTVIDLTSSLDVALFFATHQYVRHNGRDRYNFVGTNNGKAVLYLIQNNQNEMVVHDAAERVLSKLTPERPLKQHCVISRSSAFSINLPTFFLLGIVYLDFPIDGGDSKSMVASYFPNTNEDKFLEALKSGALHPEHITDFSLCDDT
jgi:FRG domain